MILWSIQPEEVFNIIQANGVYHCSTEIIIKKDFALMQYNWLADQMRKRVGNPPDGVNYPVWACYIWRQTSAKPDLRAVRHYWGRNGERYYRLKIDVPDDKVLLCDRNAWDVILNECLLSDSESEDKELEAIYESLTPYDKIIMRNKNWERLFDIVPYTPVNNDWSGKGEIIEAVFWELRKEYIREVKMFVSCSKYYKSKEAHKS